MGVSISQTAFRTKLLTALALFFAMLFPTLAAWSYFLGLAGDGQHVNRAQQLAYGAGKIVQFSFPLVFLFLVERRWPNLTWPRFSDLIPGLTFGLLVAAVMLGTYFGLLRGSSMLAKTPERLLHKLQEVDMATPARFAILAFFVVAIHSLLEEYYWRWFVFDRLRHLMSLTPAMILSGLSFAAHHVVVLYVYLPGKFLTAVVPFSLGIAVGGAIWAYLYERSGSLWSTWLSHFLVDAAIFVIGGDLLWPL
jgi:membrane protease YdiL (CAAX protease family)